MSDETVTEIAVADTFRFTEDIIAYRFRIPRPTSRP